MYRPVLVTPPSRLPVSVDEAKLHLRVDHGEDNALIEALIRAAVSHLDGWTGILGRCLVEQTWRVDFDRFDQCMRLPLGPVIEIVSVTWRDTEGQISTVNDAEYLIQTDAGGAPHLRFRNGYSFPSALYESGAVSVTFKAGYPTIPAVEADPEADPPVEASPERGTVPEAIKVAILLLVGNWYENREATVTTTSISELPFAVNALLTPYRRINL